MSFLLPIAAKAGGTKLLGAGVKQAGAILEEKLGYNFIDLVVKIIIFYAIALIIQKTHQVIEGTGGFLTDLLNFFGAGIPSSEPDFFKKLFSDEGFAGFGYWKIINFVIMGLVLFEAFMYVNTQKALGGRPSPFTLATFTLLLFLLGAYTLPDMFQKIKGGFSGRTVAEATFDPNNPNRTFRAGR